MTLTYAARALVLSVLSLTLIACSDSGSEMLPVNVIDFTDGGSSLGCVQPFFPDDQPDLSSFNPPRFLLTTSAAQQSTVGQAQVQPGDPIEAEVTVNGATRRILIELEDAWTPGRVIHSEEFETPGNQTLPIFIVSEFAGRGRFYMKLTLCGSDCKERQVLFDVVPCPEDPTPDCGKNVPYQRTLIEDGDVIQVDGTCVDLGERPNIGSGTILIQ